MDTQFIIGAELNWFRAQQFRSNGEPHLLRAPSLFIQFRSMAVNSSCLIPLLSLFVNSWGLAQNSQRMSPVSDSGLDGTRTERRDQPRAASPSYRIGIGDVVSITVYQEGDLSTEARVGEGGLIVFPLLGNIRIGGLSVSEATREIGAQLRDGYLVNPIVTLSLVEQTKAKFTILGQVSKPGPYELPANGSTSLMEAIGMAGGFTRIASPSKITVKRGADLIKVSGKEQAGGGGAAVFKVLPGDVITVQESLF